MIMKTTLKNEEIQKIILDESHICGINWVGENGLDREFILNWCGDERYGTMYDLMNVTTKLVFEFVTDFKINFDFMDRIGTIEISEFNFRKLPNNQYEVDIQMFFNPKGFIRFNCSNLYFIIEPNDVNMKK